MAFPLGLGWSDNKTADKMMVVLNEDKDDPRRLSGIAFEMAATMIGSQVVEGTYTVV